jgi:leukotriene-A4 hydrolase
MSALSKGTKESGESQVYMFEQKVPIPSYLLALAIGELECRSLGKRSFVWCEPATLQAAEYEFQDTEKFLEAAESVVSPYSWYNCTLLLAPPSYPYGGMENPNLILLTPTLIAGDRSLVDVVAHEIAHSWAGNLVTNENWQHFWLNEGFCVYIERRIVGKLHGEDVRQFKSILGWKALEESVCLFGENSPLTCLIQNLENVDPDDAFSSVPYEKGFNFLYHLEKLLGLDYFDGWLRAHFSHFEFKSLDTYQFKDFLLSYFKKNHPEKYKLLETFDFDSWLKKPGMPPVQMPFRTPLDDECKQVADSWDKIRDQAYENAISAADFNKLRVEQKMVVLDKLYDKPVFPHAVLDHMDELYRFDDYKNAEIKFRWFRLCLKAKYTKCITKAVELITSTGRMKFVRVIYR